MKILDITGMSYLVSKIKELINLKLNKADVVNTLTSIDPEKALSAKQGNELLGKIGNASVATHVTDKSSCWNGIEEIAANMSLPSFFTFSNSTYGLTTIDSMALIKACWNDIPNNYTGCVLLDCGVSYAAFVHKVNHLYGTVQIVSYAYQNPAYKRLKNGEWS